MTKMAISTARESGDVTVVTIEGQLIVANRQELKQVIQDALDTGARKFVLDFGPTAYIDSSGLGALVSINRKVREEGGELRLAGLNEDLRSLFELTKLDTLFLIADSATQALERF
jgi:anti-sigma B factor antagonist